ncbi:MAG: class II aldolase/adducin family protein [Ilumatobacteraceae bacterium]
MNRAAERDAIVAHAQAAIDAGLSTGTSGNLSVRVDDGVLITPSGVHPAEMTPDQICLVPVDGGEPDGPLRPSSEVPMHLAVYRATDAGAVVHTHPRYATAISLTHDELPAVHYTINGLGGPVRVAPYATFGTEELAAHIAQALDGRSGALLQNHGMITYGATIRQAFERSVLLEWLAALYWRSLQIGTPKILSDAELEAVREQARRLRYGAPG